MNKYRIFPKIEDHKYTSDLIEIYLQDGITETQMRKIKSIIKCSVFYINFKSNRTYSYGDTQKGQSSDVLLRVEETKLSEVLQIIQKDHYEIIGTWHFTPYHTIHK